MCAWHGEKKHREFSFEAVLLADLLGSENVSLSLNTQVQKL